MAVLFEEVLNPAIKDHGHYARTDSISEFSVWGYDDDTFFRPD